MRHREVRNIDRDLGIEEIAKLLLDQSVVQVQAAVDARCRVSLVGFREGSGRLSVRKIDNPD